MFGKNEIVGQRYFKDAADKLLVTSLFVTLQGEGPYRGLPSVFVRFAKCNLNCAFCFAGSTYITMSDGNRKAIKDIHVGDKVLSVDQKNHFEDSIVTKTFKRKVNKILLITTQSQNEGWNQKNDTKTYVTHEHPFQVISNSGYRWVKADQLRINDIIDAEYVNERVIAIEELSGHYEVYNFEADPHHTYVANGMVVHNCDTFFDRGDWLTIAEIEQKIERALDSFFLGSPPDWAMYDEESGKKRQMVLVVTGGEPMLQSNIVPFLHHFNKQFVKTQIESNGTVYQPIPDETTLVISPKCSEKTGKYLSPRPENMARADCLKFVVSADKTSPYYSIPQFAQVWLEDKRMKGDSLERIFISPMNIYNREPQKSKQIRSEKDDISLEERSTVDEVISFWEEGLLNMKENQKNHEHAAMLCMNYGAVLNLQLHLYASLP